MFREKEKESSLASQRSEHVLDTNLRGFVVVSGFTGLNSDSRPTQRITRYMPFKTHTEFAQIFELPI